MSKKSYIYILDWTKEHDCIKIGKADNIWKRYQSLKGGLGEANLEKSYWIEYPSKNILGIENLLHLISRKYHLPDAVEKNIDGHTELFSVGALNDIKDFCEKYDLILHKGIVPPKSTKKKKTRHIKSPEEKQEEFERMVHQNQRNIKRCIHLFKVIQNNPENWIIKDVREVWAGERYIRTSIKTRFPVREKFFDWAEKFNKISVILPSSSFCSLILIYSWRWYEDETVELRFGENFLNCCLPIGARDSHGKGEHYDTFYANLLRELNVEIQKTLALKAQPDFDSEAWLHPKYEWNDSQEPENLYGLFEIISFPSERPYKFQLKVSDISEINKSYGSWVIELNSGKSLTLNKEVNVSVGETKVGNYLADHENYYKFNKFLEDLFNLYGETYVPKKATKRVYSVDELDNLFD